MSLEKNLYNFPYKPYPQQVALMSELYSVIENRKVGIFESPTGTGKSLSLLCSSLHWILKNQIDEINQLERHKLDIKNAENDFQTNIDWIAAYDKKQKLSLKLMENIENLEKKNKLVDYIKDIKLKSNIKNEKKIFNHLDIVKDIEKGEDEFLVDYESDDQICDPCEVDKEKEGSITKIYYCSRTHLQLSQVLKELLKTNYSEKIVTCSLGSRQNLCINTLVNKLKSVNLINEKCLEMQKQKKNNKENCEPSEKKRKTKTKTCQFKSLSKTEEMSKHIIQSCMDIEELYNVGLKTDCCPFYSVRNTLNKAHLVLMPYQNLLNPAARLASEIDLKDNIIIIDEAHNLSDTISAVNSVTLTMKDIKASVTQLNQYLTKYLSRFSPKNLSYLRQLIDILLNMENFLKSDELKMPSLSCVDFVFKANLNNFKIDKLLNYLDKSKLTFKLRNSRLVAQTEDAVVLKTRKTVANLFGNMGTQKDNIDSLEENNENMTNALLTVKNFLEAIYYSLDARILIDIGQSLTFLVVDPGKYLTDIIQQCRSLIVIGGTMRPFNEFSDRLFKVAGCASDKIHTFSCDHVINAAEQMKVMSLGVGLSGELLKFTFENRTDLNMIKAGGNLIRSVLSCSPKGAVIFFPSYAYMKEIIDVWKSSGILSDLEKIKLLFFESKQTSQSENIMHAFSIAARSSKGAVLFAVIGAKMSEGINFDDDLARIVIVIGIPYPQKNNLILQEKIRFVQIQYGSEAAQIMYENLAMKSLNQAIGRAIRHKSDYAAVLLLDVRFANIVKMSKCDRIDEKKPGLPHWMMEAASVQHDATSMLSELKTFFDNKK